MDGESICKHGVAITRDCLHCRFEIEATEKRRQIIDKVALKAMKAMLANPVRIGASAAPTIVAKDAFDYAEAMYNESLDRAAEPTK
jgi:hypothetical protein